MVRNSAKLSSVLRSAEQQETRGWYTRRVLFARSAAGAIPLGLVLVGAGCNRTQARATGTAPPASDAGAVAAQRYGGQHLGGTATGDTQAGANFARWVLEQDPRRQYITEAVVRGEQTLGVKVQPNVTRADTQQMMTALAEGMSKAFPGKALKVIAFYQSGDKLAEADYTPRTGRVDVQFVR
jgi:hypothetical protein